MQHAKCDAYNGLPLLLVPALRLATSLRATAAPTEWRAYDIPF
jgi:hypothetical protein